jgi:hypothetical protein
MWFLHKSEIVGRPSRSLDTAWTLHHSTGHRRLVHNEESVGTTTHGPVQCQRTVRTVEYSRLGAMLSVYPPQILP